MKTYRTKQKIFFSKLMIYLGRMSLKKRTPEKSEMDKTMEMLNKHRLYRKGEWYLFDISPCDNLQGYTQKYLGVSGHTYVDCADELTRYKKFYKKWNSILCEFRGVKKIEYCIEFSKVGRLHLHTNMLIEKPLTFSNYIGYFCHVYGNKINYKLDAINDLNKRKLYLLKDEELFNDEFEISNNYTITKFGKKTKLQKTREEDQFKMTIEK